MRPVETRDANVMFSKPKNWDDIKDGPCGGLSVRREVFGAGKRLDHVSTWRPTAEELEHLNRGGVIELSCIGVQPPVMLSAVDPVECDTAFVEVPDRPSKAVVINEAAHGFDDHGPAYP